VRDHLHCTARQPVFYLHAMAAGAGGTLTLMWGAARCEGWAVAEEGRVLGEPLLEQRRGLEAAADQVAVESAARQVCTALRAQLVA
jgi:hypothetical protein